MYACRTCCTFTMDGCPSWSEMAKKHKLHAPGHRQREQSVEYAEAPFSHLARYLLEEFAFGGVSANQVQKLAWMAKRDGLQHTAVDKLASLGANGKHPGNCNRDLNQYMSKYLHPHVQPQIDCVLIPLKILKGERLGTHLILHYYLAPHKLMSYMYKEFKNTFQDAILGQEGAMEEFWSGIADDDPRAIQLANDHPDYKTKCIPIIIHGDGVPCTNNHSLDTISFESILAKRNMGTACSTLDYIFCITGVFTQTIDNKDTNGLGKTKTQMWKCIVHSLKACYYGHWPDKDPLGNDFPVRSQNHRMGSIRQEIMGGFVLVPWVIKGDMDFQINHFELPGHWKSPHPCPACPCNRVQNSPMAWNNFSPTAQWKGECFKTVEAFAWHCASLNKPTHLLFQPMEQGGLGMHPQSLYMDNLHVVDLGVAMHVGGNVLHLLCYGGMLQNTAAENMKQLWGEISQLYDRYGTTSQFPHLGLRSFCNPDSPHADFPKLKGKGAQIRHLIPILAIIWSNHMDVGNRHDQHVKQMLEHLRMFYKCLDFTNAKGKHPFKPPPNIAKQILKHVESFLVHYNFLAEKSLTCVPAKHLWNLATKHHYFWHLAMQAKDLNPRFTWCYANEDFVGKISTIGMSCRHGQVAAYRSKSLMAKYTLGIVLRMFHAH